MYFQAYHCLDETRPCAGIFSSYNTKVIILVILLLWSLTSFQLSFLYAKVFQKENAEEHVFAMFCSTVGLACLALVLSQKLLLKHLLLLNIFLSGIFATTQVLLEHVSDV